MLKSWLGVSLDQGASGGEEGGICVQDPRKLVCRVTLDSGEHGQVIGTAHELHAMAHLLDLFNPANEGIGVGCVVPITHPIVFCPSNAIARKCLAIFKALAGQRAARAERQGDQPTRAMFKALAASAGHVYQSDVSLGGAGQSYERQQRLIWRFRLDERAVLFNVDLLSTGIDLPCCDCAYQLMPTKVRGQGGAPPPPTPRLSAAAAAATPPWRRAVQRRPAVHRHRPA